MTSSVALKETLLQTARRITPVIRQHSDEAERERRLSKPVLQALSENGLVRMFTPRSLGGLEVDPITCCRVVEEISRADAVAGWTLLNPLNWTFASARLPDAGARDIFSGNPNALIAGPFHPPMRAIPENGAIESRAAVRLAAIATTLTGSALPPC